MSRRRRLRRWFGRYVKRIRRSSRRKAPETRRYVTWNCRVGRGDVAVLASVQQLIRDTRPHVLVLQEAAGYVDALRNVPGYRLHAEHGWAEAANCVTLVRADLPSEPQPPIRCRTGWRGPKAGRRHVGRTYPVVDVAGWLTVNVHRTRPGWSTGGRAFAEEYDRLLAATRRHRGPVVIIGDQNIGTRRGRDRGRHTPWALAKALRGRVVTTTRGRVDYAVVRGVRGKAKQLGKYGSDHHAVIVTLTKE